MNSFSTDLVTVIIPCYNACATIEETIQSVLDQTYKKWELIIIDDCSTDNSPIIIKKFIDSDSRIIYLKTQKPSGSPSVPRNMGIEFAKGEYIAFLDADDIWLPNKLEKQLTFIKGNGYKLVYSYYEKISFEGKRENRIIRTRKSTRYSDLLKSNSIPCLTAIVLRDIIGDTRFKQIPQEDFCFWLDILRKGYIGYNLCEVTALYREVKNSRSANKLDMFKGYWNVIRKHQHVNKITCCYVMLTYTIFGIMKYIK